MGPGVIRLLLGHWPRTIGPAQDQPGITGGDRRCRPAVTTTRPAVVADVRQLSLGRPAPCKEAGRFPSAAARSSSRGPARWTPDKRTLASLWPAYRYASLGPVVEVAAVQESQPSEGSSEAIAHSSRVRSHLSPIGAVRLGPLSSHNRPQLSLQVRPICLRNVEVGGSSPLTSTSCDPIRTGVTRAPARCGRGFALSGIRK
jgi:hypothetical protein